MNAPLPFVSEPTLEALGWTLVHFLWQGIIVFLVLESTLQFAKLRSPQVRYGAACVALLLMLVLPLTTFRSELASARARSVESETGALDVLANETPGETRLAAAEGNETWVRQSKTHSRRSKSKLSAPKADRKPSVAVSPRSKSKSKTRHVTTRAPEAPHAPHAPRAATAPRAPKAPQAPWAPPAPCEDAATRAPQHGFASAEPTVTTLAELEASQEEREALVPWTSRFGIDTFLARVESLLPWCVAAWFAGVVFLMFRLVLGWTQAQQLGVRGLRAAPHAVREAVERLSERLGVRQSVRVFESALAEVPTVVGWLKPVVLVPTSALAGLTPQQLEAILAHELAHVRRHDYVINLIQTVVETLLFYHPAVWWVSERIREEREHCCDDLAVHACGDRFAYVRALTALEELRSVPAGLSVAMAADGGSLLSRVQRLVGRGQTHSGSPARGAAGFVAVAIVFVLGVGMQRAGAVGAETEPWNSNTASAPAASAPRAASTPSPSDASSEPKNVLGQRSARKGEAQPASQLRGPARSSTPTSEDGDARRLTVEQLVALRLAGVDAGYIESMRELGFQDLDDMMRMRQAGVDAGFVRELQRAGFEQLSAHELTHLRSHGVDAKFTRSMREAGFDDVSLNGLVRLRNQGVDARFVQGLRAAGYDVTPEEAIRLLLTGVDADFVHAMAEAGYDNLDVDDLATLGSIGVDPDFMDRMRDAVGEPLDLEDFAALRRYGVDPDYVEAMRGMWDSLDIDELVRLRLHGVDPSYAQAMLVALPDIDADDMVMLRQRGCDPAFVDAMQRVLDVWDVDELVALQQFGVHADWMEAVMDATGETYDADELIQLRKAGVDAGWLRTLRDAGLDDFDADTIRDLRRRGAKASNWREIHEDMCPEDSNDGGSSDGAGDAGRNDNDMRLTAAVEEMRSLGLEDLSVDELIELRQHGVDAPYVREMVDAGLEASPNVLLHLRNHGVEPHHIRAIRDGDPASLTVRDLVTLKNAGIDGDVLDRLQEAKR